MKNTFDARPALADLVRRARRAGVDEAKEILRVAQERAPVLSGTLRDSGRVVETATGARVEFTAPYAAAVHEDMDARHAHGEAKFLQSARFEASDQAAANIAARSRKG